MNAQELRNPKKVSEIWVKNSTEQDLSKMKYPKSLMIVMKPKEALKLNMVELDKFETYHGEEGLPEDGSCKYLNQLDEQHGHQKRRANQDFI